MDILTYNRAQLAEDYRTTKHASRAPNTIVIADNRNRKLTHWRHDISIKQQPVSSSLATRAFSLRSSRLLMASDIAISVNATLQECCYYPTSSKINSRNRRSRCFPISRAISPTSLSISRATCRQRMPCCNDCAAAAACTHPLRTAAASLAAISLASCCH